MKWIRNSGITIIVLVLLYLLLKQLNWIPNISNWFKSKPLLIENTPLIVENIKQMNQLITISSYDEVVMSKTNATNGSIVSAIIINKTFTGTKQIALIAKGTLFAGMDLKELTENDVFVKNDSVSIKLPTTKILDAIINPSDTEIFIEEGKWDLMEINKLKSEAKDLLIQRAKERKLLEKAQLRGKLIIENFLLSMGFKKITILTTTIY
jgi:hypothetical protein